MVTCLWLIAVEPLCLHDQILLKAIIEESKAGTDDRFRCGIFLPAQAPRESYARRPIAMIVDAVLRFKPQPIAEGHVGTYLPVVFGVKPAIDKSVFGQRIAGQHRELRRLAVVEVCQWSDGLLRDRISCGAERKRSIKVLRGKAGVAGNAQPASQAQEMISFIDRRIVLQLIVISDRRS